MIYYFLLFFISILCLLKVSYNYRTVYVEFLFLFLMIIISTFRSDSVGADTKVYLMFFRDTPNIFNFNFNFLAHIELGFRLYMSFVKTLTSSEVLFLFLSSFLCITPVFLGLKKLKLKYALIGLLVYFLVFFVNYPNSVIRQGMAMGLFIFSIPFMLERKSLVVFIIALIATFLHSTGFIILLCYLFLKIPLRKALILTGFFGFLTIILYQFKVMQYILFNYVSTSAEDVYTVQFSESTSIFQYLYRIVLSVVLGGLIFKVNNDFYKKLFLFYLLGLFVYIGLSDNNLLAARFNMFFRMLEVVLIPYSLWCIKDKFFRLPVFLFFLLYLLAFFIKALIIPYNQYEILDFI